MAASMHWAAIATVCDLDHRRVLRRAVEACLAAANDLKASLCNPSPGGNGVADWVNSKTIGGVSELTLFTPIRQGIIPGETRSYEQRLTDELRELSERVEAGRANPILRIPTIHFARWLILVPGQYFYQDAGGTVENYPYHSWLLFTAYFDGDVKTYLDDFRRSWQRTWTVSGVTARVILWKAQAISTLSGRTRSITS